MKFSFFIYLFFCTVLSADEKTEKMIKEQIIQFRENMTSDDKAVREKALKGILPDKNTFLLFLSEKEFSLIEERVLKANERRIANAGKISKELNKGKILSVSLSPLSEKYEKCQVIKRVKFPTYSAAIRTEGSTSGSSAYFLENGKLKRIQGLHMLDKIIEMAAKK